MSFALRVRQIINALNLSTVLGLIVAKSLGASLHRGPDGLVIATGARGSFPRASAFTIGNVIVARGSLPGSDLQRHEARHSSQWACCVVAFLPLYMMASVWSYFRAGNHFSHNVFERRAGLAEGGYPEPPGSGPRRRGGTGQAGGG
ncbi:unannotated protein [freshwater metagenome]|uniref:Unannotated protein n=1 Tax=freshwater metagenome TaxID=449393 RepID=A0A6J7I6T7_9ZZZZ|nr:hypothetical protein [Actinomycetota bacterium]MSW35760.1 hypothetical protein [Actinomycetota bacterium]MSX38489.1 hypothetical protein [Actinomycetota bacterium]